MWNPHLGYVLTCPPNLGTGLRAGVHIKLPHLGKHETFPEVLNHLTTYVSQLMLYTSHSAVH